MQPHPLWNYFPEGYVIHYYEESEEPGQLKIRLKIAMNDRIGRKVEIHKNGGSYPISLYDQDKQEKSLKTLDVETKRKFISRIFKYT
jgi:hypothetical protein